MSPLSECPIVFVEKDHNNVIALVRGLSDCDQYRKASKQLLYCHTVFH